MTEMTKQEDENGEEGEGGMEESNDDDDDATGTENEGIENGESGMEVEPPEADSQAATVRILDQLLFSILSTLRKICSVCSVLRDSTHCEIMNQIWGEFILARVGLISLLFCSLVFGGSFPSLTRKYLETRLTILLVDDDYFSVEQVRVLLLHPHAWVRLTSSQLYGLLFSKYTPDELVATATQEEGSGRSQAKGSKSKKKRKSTQKKEYIHQETIIKVTRIYPTGEISYQCLFWGGGGGGGGGGGWGGGWGWWGGGGCFRFFIFILCVGSRFSPCLLYTTELPFSLC